MIDIEPELVVRGITLTIVIVVLAFVGIAYHRTRLRQLFVLFLLALLLGLNVAVGLGDEVLENGVPFFGLLDSLFALGIALLLLATIARRFRWSP